jgi:flagellar biosynthesis protein FlgN
MRSSSISQIDHLNEEYDAMASLLELIKQEQKYLIEANIEDLTKATEGKSKIVEKIAELAKDRHQGLASAGYPPNDASMQIWLEKTSDIVASSIWSKLLEIAQSAKELNRTNGLLINQHLTRNRNALNALQGTSDGSHFYGPNGRSTTKPSPRRLVIG